MNHLKPEDLKLVFRPACYINKASESTTPKKTTPTLERHPGKMGTVAFKRRINKNIHF